MSTPPRPNRPLLIALIALLLGAVLLGGAAYSLLARVGQPPTPNLAEPINLESLASQYPQLAALLQDPKMGSLLKAFVIEYQRGGVDGAKAFARARGLMNANDDITLTLLTDTDDAAVLGNLERDLTALGAEVLGQRQAQPSGAELFVVIPWSAVESQIKAGNTLEQLLSSISQLSHVRGVLPKDPSAPKQASPVKQTNPLFKPLHSGISEGVQVTNADAWQAAGFTGAGVKIGILDPEVSYTKDYIQRGVLPASTQVFTKGCVRSGNRRVDDEGIHGVAAAEIVHEMAPEAQLFIACALGGDAALNWLLSNDVRIISHSAGSFAGPRDGSGTFEAQVNKLAQQGVLWVNAAGNSGQTVHRGHLTGGSSAYAHEFAPNQTSMALRAVGEGVQIELNWDEWRASTVSDYDLFLYDDSGQLIARSDNDSTAIKRPYEALQAPTTPNALYYVVVRGDRATRAASFLVECRGAEAIEFPSPGGSIASPALAEGAFTVGAVPWNSESIAPYSSRGPSDDGRVKPDIAAPTEVSSDVYGGEFAGTSSAAPHVSGAAALVWGRSPDLTRDQVVAFLLGQTQDLGDTGADNDFGAGLLKLGAPVSAQAAATAVPLPTAAPNPAATPQPIQATRPTQPPSTPAPTPTPEVWQQEGPSAGASAGLVLVLIGIGVMGGLLFAGGLVAVFSVLRHSKPALAAAGSAQPSAQVHAPTVRAPPAQAAARFCTQCGAPLAAKSKFCPRCGQKADP